MSKTSKNGKLTKTEKEMSKIRSNKSNSKGKIANLLYNGRVELTTKEELEEYEIGTMISYMNKLKLFVNGGFVTELGSSYFCYVTLDFKRVKKVNYEDVIKMWVGDVFKMVNDWISLVPTQNSKTNYPIEVAGVVIYYSPNRYNMIRFLTTVKYTRLIQWCEYFLTDYPVGS